MEEQMSNQQAFSEKSSLDNRRFRWYRGRDGGGIC